MAAGAACALRCLLISPLPCVAVLQVLHLKAAVRAGDQKLRLAMETEAKLRYQVGGAAAS